MDNLPQPASKRLGAVLATILAAMVPTPRDERNQAPVYHVKLYSIDRSTGLRSVWLGIREGFKQSHLRHCLMQAASLASRSARPLPRASLKARYDARRVTRGTQGPKSVLRHYSEVFSFNQVPVVPPLDPKMTPKRTMSFISLFISEKPDWNLRTDLLIFARRMENARLCCRPLVPQDPELLHSVCTGSLFADASGFPEHVGSIRLPSTIAPALTSSPFFTTLLGDLRLLMLVSDRPPLF